MSAFARRVARQLARAGQPITLSHETGLCSLIGFIQPRGMGSLLPTPLGQVNQQEYLYLGSAYGAGALAQPGSLLLCGGVGYRVESLRDYCFGGGAVLRTGVLTRCHGEEDTHE